MEHHHQRVLHRRARRRTCRLVLAAAPASARPDDAAAAKPEPRRDRRRGRRVHTLVSLHEAGGVSPQTLSGAGRHTVFAPTDAAFKKVPKKTIKRSARTKAKLEAVLRSTTSPRAGLPPSASSALVGHDAQRRARARFASAAGNAFVNLSKVVTADVREANGIIHAVNPRPDFRSRQRHARASVRRYGRSRAAPDSLRGAPAMRGDAASRRPRLGSLGLSPVHRREERAARGSTRNRDQGRSLPGQHIHAARQHVHLNPLLQDVHLHATSTSTSTGLRMMLRRASYSMRARSSTR